MKDTIFLLATALALHAGSVSARQPQCAGDSAAGMPHAKFYGTVEKMPGSGIEGVWRVNGRDLVVTKKSKVKEEYGTARVGSYVEVEGCLAGSTFTVYEMEVQESRRGDHHRMGLYNCKFTGIIEGMPQDGYEGVWVVAGRQVEVGTATLIDETLGKASNGCRARIKGVRAGNRVRAVEIVVIEVS